ncbi:hypothetical protein BGW80DRAFT_292906 [Lactifluus volemus]|nr:hypothetical protein BGW80DRAFT_292906 [Lactifluus volemus]
MATPNRSWSQYPLRLQIECKDFDWQVASAVQILDTFSPVLSGVDDLTLSHVVHNRLSELHDEVDRTQWRKLFRPFRNVKKLCVSHSLSGRLSRSLSSENGEMPLELLPNLLDLQDLDGIGFGDVFTSFINERRAAGHSVILSPFNPSGTHAFLTQTGGPIQIRRPTLEDMVHAHRWVEEQKRAAFGQFDGVAVARLSPVPESDIAEYGRYLDRLDKVLGSIEQYILIAYASMQKGDVIRRVYHMMASTKYQLGEMNKPNPRLILELHTIWGMFQEADNMDKGLRTVLGIGMRPSGVAPSSSAPPQ